jgi:hypothetical protein
MNAKQFFQIFYGRFVNTAVFLDITRIIDQDIQHLGVSPHPTHYFSLYVIRRHVCHYWMALGATYGLELERNTRLPDKRKRRPTSLRIDIE